MPLSIPHFLRPLVTRPVAIFGGGVSGRAVMALLSQIGVTAQVFDEKGAAVGAVNNFPPAASYKTDLVVFSPGFPANHRWLRAARSSGATCLGELDFASLFWSGRVIAVTGTNGKTTLTEFLTHALRAAGEDARAAGNIGFPLSQLAADESGGNAAMIAVCEVSSFQAETLQHFRAEAVLWTNFAEDHLERHPGIEAYFEAKQRLLEKTDAGSAFVGTSVAIWAEKLGRSLPGGVRVISEVKTPDSRLGGTVFCRPPQSENFSLAAAWWSHSGRDEAVLFEAARSFRLGSHRLARVGEIDGVTYWNDSKATNFHAVEAALAGFETPVLLIAGGKAKGGDIAAFVRRIAPRVKRAFLIGETKNVLATFCRAYGVAHVDCANLADAVRAAHEAAGRGDHILLSPGFASFDQFRNYEDRGKQFEAIVNNLGVSPTLG